MLIRVRCKRLGCPEWYPQSVAGKEHETLAIGQSARMTWAAKPPCPGHQEPFSRSYFSLAQQLASEPTSEMEPSELCVDRRACVLHVPAQSERMEIASLLEPMQAKVGGG